MSDRRLPVLVLLAVVIAIAPSLGGDWVWDDWTWKDQTGEELAGALTRQTFGGIWRPLSSLSITLVHLVWPDPLPHKLANLALHLGAVSGVAWTARSLGARPWAAWAGAAAFGLHPGVTEAVCWIGARTEVLPATLLIVGLAAWINGRRGLATACLLLAPFGKEAYLAGLLSLTIWMWTLRRRDLPVLVAVGASGGAFVLARVAVAGSAVEGATYHLAPLPAFGAAALRGATLLVDTTAPDLWNPYVPAPTLGVAVLVGGLLATVAARGRPALGAILAGLPPVVPSALAASSTLLLADRYYYTPLAGAGIALALGLERLAGSSVRRGIVALVAVGVPLALGVATTRRAFEWRSERALAVSSWSRHPDNALAAEHYAYAEERWGAGCAAGMEAWRVAATLSRSGGVGLQRCLVRTGQYAEALALTPSLALSADVATEATLAALALGDPATAERWARAALAADPTSADAQALLAHVLAQTSPP